MPAWLHSRADHIKAKNPDMKEETAFAIATQQSHATGHTPKGYGTAEGKAEAKKKYDKPKSEYVHTSDPKKEANLGKFLTTPIPGTPPGILDHIKRLMQHSGNAPAIRRPRPMPTQRTSSGAWDLSEQARAMGIKGAAYQEGVYTALEKLGMKGPPPIPAAAKKLADPKQQRLTENMRKLKNRSHPSQLGVVPGSPNKSLHAMV